MTRDTSLAREDYAIADVRTSRKSNLRTEQRVFAYRARVTNLNEVIELRSPADATLAD
jgi:hypothetical protein